MRDFAADFLCLFIISLIIMTYAGYNNFSHLLSVEVLD